MTTPATGELLLQGRILPASNATFLAHLDDLAVVYKPIAGERPLWDFPTGTLAYREVATYLVSEASGWDLVPPTWLADGPHGIGMVQTWQEVDPASEAVTLVPAGEMPDNGWCHVFDGVGADEQLVSLIHEDSPALRRMAVLDAIVNNADRKGGHVLAMPSGHRYGVDHGLTFHAEPKLRTVLWGWLGTPLSDEELDGVRRIAAALTDDLGKQLAELLDEAELTALAARCEQLLAEGLFPEPDGTMPAVPWPPF